jgi:hypothetical protein
MSKKTVIATIVSVVLDVAVAASLYWFFRARSMTAFSVCPHTLMVIDGCKQEWELENRKTTNDTPTWNDLRPYLPKDWTNGTPRCPEGGTYTAGRIGDPPKCSLGGPRHSMPQ